MPQSIKIFSGLTKSAAPPQTRIFAEVDGQLIDVQLAYAAYLFGQGDKATAYDFAAACFPSSIAAFLAGGEGTLDALRHVVESARRSGFKDLRGPGGERVVYDANELRLLPPLANPEKSFVIGFSDRARTEALPQAEIPTGFYKLPQTFVTDVAPVVWPKFSQEVDADGCLAIVIGKAGKRIAPEKAWDHVAGAMLVIDITARDINRREGLTTNNLLGKNFPSSTCLGQAVLLGATRQEIEGQTVELSLDNQVQQKFSLRDCVFSVEQMIAHWSILGIKPGDWFAIGASMALQDDRLQNPVPLKVGSTLRCSSPALGELSHPVVAAGGLGG